MRAKPCSGSSSPRHAPPKFPKMKRGAVFIWTPRHETREGRRSVKRIAHLIFCWGARSNRACVRRPGCMRRQR